MPTELSTNRLWVLSDLHLAPAGEQCVFQAHEALTGLIQQLSAMPVSEPPQWLILNGDVFDYLQTPGYEALSLPLAVQRTTQILDALDAEPRGRNVVQALRSFTARGHRLSLMPGNHDPELCLAPVQALLSHRLGSTTVLAPWAGEWRLNIAGLQVVGRHGHHGDAFNAISSAEMLSAQAAGSEQVSLPPGSRLVLQVINPFRRAKTAEGKRRFPFIDSLPSEQAVLLAIMLLDPLLAAKRLPSALGIGAAALIRRALMSSGLHGQLLSGGEAARAQRAGSSSWLSSLELVLGDAASHQGLSSLDYELDAYFAGAALTSVDQAPGLLAQSGKVRGMLLEALSRSLTDSRTAFCSSHTDALAQDAMATWGKNQLAFAGHTHAPRSICGQQGPEQSNTCYINTGTWIDQVLPPAGLSATAISKWLEKLHQGELSSWNGYPVAIVDQSGARLLSWNGRNLQAWQDPVTCNNQA